jgi:hypothetical protein
VTRLTIGVRGDGVAVLCVLVDGLAVEFVESGWNLKHIQRLMVTSTTYRQASRASPRLQEKDPANRLLTRGPRFRLDAEGVRDNALAISGPELTDVSGESRQTFERYGDQARRPGTFAANCLLARRLAERGVRFVQLYHRGWDQHYNLPSDIRLQCQDVDRPCAALITDLKERGLLDETLVVWGGEFGRTVYSQGKLSSTDYGRDHHGRCFTMWAAGGGIRPGISYGRTDDYCYNIVRDPVHVHDLNATLLHCLGIDHERLTFRFQGREFRLTDVHGRVVKEILA